MAGRKSAPAKLQHSIKVPRLYKRAANIAKRVTEERCGLKELLFNANKHLNIQGLYALISKTFHHEDTLERLIKKSKILKERKVDPWLIRILITELLFGKQSLSGDSKPVQAVLSYHQMFLAELKETEKAGSHSFDSYQNRGNVKNYS